MRLARSRLRCHSFCYIPARSCKTASDLAERSYGNFLRINEAPVSHPTGAYFFAPAQYFVRAPRGSSSSCLGLHRKKFLATKTFDNAPLCSAQNLNFKSSKKRRRSDGLHKGC
jgi:hypothetical protein